MNNFINFFFSLLENVINNTDLLNNIQSTDGLRHILEALGQGVNPSVMFLQILGGVVTCVNFIMSLHLTIDATGTASNSLHN